MTIQEAKRLCREIKRAIKYANDSQDLNRVQWLKSKRTEIKRRILIAKTNPKINENLAYNRYALRPREDGRVLREA